MVKVIDKVRESKNIDWMASRLKEIQEGNGCDFMLKFIIEALNDQELRQYLVYLI